MMIFMNIVKKLSLVLPIISIVYCNQAVAGVFDLASFLDPGLFSVGFEPDIVISSPSGAGVTFKPKYGLNDFMNIEGIIGTGSGARRFRVGAILDFDFIPDVDMQPGFGLPLNLLFAKIQDSSEFSLGMSPLLYKTFAGTFTDYIPFVSVPMGWVVRDFKIKPFFQGVMGSMFKIPKSNKVKVSIEAGFNIVNSFSYLSGGVIFYF